MKHFKSEVDTIKMDRECGLVMADRDLRFEVGDIITCYDVREVEQEIDWSPGF